MDDEETPLLTPEAVELLGKPGNAVFCTLMPDGTPQATVAGILVDGNELVAHTAPRMQRVKNLRADPRITVVVVDPDDPKRYVEVRGVATLRECSPEDVGPLFKAQAEKYGLPVQAGRLPPGMTVVQVRIKPVKVNYMEFTFARMGPKTGQASGPGPGAGADGVVARDGEGYWIEFSRRYDHEAAAVWAALTEPRRLALWEHPVQYFPRLELGATIYANLNFEAGAVALGKITELDPPRAFGFRWTTNNPMLPPEFGLRFVFGEDRILRVRSGPFQASHGVVPLMASMHIHLDHLGAAITAPEAELASEPWPEKSVVTRSGRMMEMARVYGKKAAAEHPELPASPPRPDHMRSSR
jgi:PPOX class probable F420-dependent enzyme